MTANRDLKRRVRDRQAQTGESYMTALHHVLAQRRGGIPSAIPTVEFVDVTELAARLGFACRVTVSPGLAHTIDVERTLGRLLETLVGTQPDPALWLMRIAVLQGVAVQGQMPPLSSPQIQQTVRFVNRARAGLGGVSEDGCTIALRAVPRSASTREPPATSGSPPAAADERIALFGLWVVPSFAAARPPLLIVSPPDWTMLDHILDRFAQELP